MKFHFIELNDNGSLHRILLGICLSWGGVWVAMLPNTLKWFGHEYHSIGLVRRRKGGFLLNGTIAYYFFSECTMRHVKAATGSLRNILVSEAFRLQLGTLQVMKFRLPVLPNKGLRTRIDGPGEMGSGCCWTNRNHNRMGPRGNGEEGDRCCCTNLKSLWNGILKFSRDDQNLEKISGCILSAHENERISVVSRGTIL